MLVHHKLIQRLCLITGAFVLLYPSTPVAHAANYEVRATAVQIAMPNVSRSGEHLFTKGQAIVDVPLLWRQAAMLATDLKIMIDGREQSIASTTALPLHLVEEEKRVGRGIVAFCTPRRAGENKTEKGVLGVLLGGGSLWRTVVKSATDRQICFIDTEQDGSVDQWMLIGDGSVDARVPNPMAPVQYTLKTNVPISDKDRFTIYFDRASRSGKWVEFRLEIMQQGGTRRFDTMSTASGVYGHIERREHTHSGWPLTTSVSGVDLIVSGVEDKGKKIRIFWPTSIDTERQIELPEAYEITVRYY